MSLTALASEQMDAGADPEAVQNEDGVTESEEMEPFEMMGVNLPYPQEIMDSKGLVLVYPIGGIDDMHHVYVMVFVYIGLPQEDAIRIMYSPDVTEEEEQTASVAQGINCALVATDVDFDETRAIYESEMKMDGNTLVDFDAAEEITSADGYTFYFVPAVPQEEYLSVIGEEYAEEFQQMEQILLESLRSAEYYAPVDEEKERVGQKLEFTTTDSEGNPVTSEELFSQNKITMINCWGLWCPYCIDEMEELAEIHLRLQEKGCGILGMEWEETTDLSAYMTPEEMAEAWGTTYPNVVMPVEILSMPNIYPMSLFVDSEGTILCMPIMGPRIDQYESILDELLSGQ